MFSGIWRKAKKKNMKKERKFGLKEFPRPLYLKFGGNAKKLFRFIRVRRKKKAAMAEPIMSYQKLLEE